MKLQKSSTRMPVSGPAGGLAVGGGMTVGRDRSNRLASRPMFLPLSDAPNPRGIPWVTYLLIAACVAVYLFVNLPLSLARPDPGDPVLREYLRVMAPRLPPQVSVQALYEQTSQYDLFVFEHGYRPGDPSIVDLLVSMFLHGGLVHLLGNMLFLWIYGDNVEYRLGRVGYLLSYLATGVAATLFFALFSRGSQVPLVGASGAISGVLGFYFLWFPRNVVRVYVFLFPILMDVVEVSARVVLGFYLLLDNLLPFLLARGGSGGVAHGAHLGGFAAGLGVAFLFDRANLGGRPREYRERRLRQAERPAGDAAAIEAAIEQGRFAEAAQLYFAPGLGHQRPRLEPHSALRLAGWLAESGHSEAALAVYRRHLRDHPAGPGAAEAHLGAGLVLLHALHQVAPAYQHLLEVLDLDPPPHVAARARTALEEISAMQKLHLRRRSSAGR
jgi:membrane associated rhomboid family serine protease